jgi:ribosomal protein S18 acetylase RimI-like enzyme
MNNNKKIAVELSTLRLADIALVVNLILDGSRQGHFTDLYLQWLYVAGLAKQIFGLMLTSRITLPDGSTFATTTRTVRVDGDFAGFLILRHVAQEETEIYMCAMAPQFLGQGIGKWMIESALAELPDQHIVFADCLTASMAMRHVLLGLGFKEIYCGPDGTSRHLLAIERQADEPTVVRECHAA